MNKKTITPNPTQPVNRIPTGQLPPELAELSEAVLQAEAGDLGDRSNVLPLLGMWPCGQGGVTCSFSGDDDE